MNIMVKIAFRYLACEFIIAVYRVPKTIFFICTFYLFYAIIYQITGHVKGDISQLLQLYIGGILISILIAWDTYFFTKQRIEIGQLMDAVTFPMRPYIKISIQQFIDTTMSYTMFFFICFIYFPAFINIFKPIIFILPSLAVVAITIVSGTITRMLKLHSVTNDKKEKTMLKITTACSVMWIIWYLLRMKNEIYLTATKISFLQSEGLLARWSIETIIIIISNIIIANAITNELASKINN